MKDNLKTVGIWGKLHYEHLKRMKPEVICVMRIKGNLIPYLQNVNEQAEKKIFQLTEQIAKK